MNKKLLDLNQELLVLKNGESIGLCLADDANNSSSKGDVQEYLSEQDEPAAQKIEIPDQLSEESPDEEKTK